MPLALDTNLLVYAEGLTRRPADEEKGTRFQALLAQIPDDEIKLPLQAVGELYRVLTGKGGWSRARAHRAVEEWLAAYSALETSTAVMGAAFNLAVRHRVSIWDAVIMAAADEAGCDMLLSEDLQHGFAWRGVTVINPFAATTHPLLAALLRRNTRR